MYILYNGNNPVLAFDFKESYLHIMNDKYLPYTLKDQIENVGHKDAKGTMADLNLIKSYLINRPVICSRADMMKILGVNEMPTELSVNDRLRIILTKRCRSPYDNYWLGTEADVMQYNKYNLRRNINLSVADFTDGLEFRSEFPKYWRNINGFIEAWETDAHKDQKYTQIQLAALQMLRQAGVQLIAHRKETTQDIDFTVSLCNTTCKQSFVSAREIANWCQHTGRNFTTWIMTRAREDFANMCIADYIMANTDRDPSKWGMMVNEHNQFTTFAPLDDIGYDCFNSSLGNELDNMIYEPTGLTFTETLRKYGQWNTLDFDNVDLPPICRWRLQKAQYYINDTELSAIA